MIDRSADATELDVLLVVVVEAVEQVTWVDTQAKSRDAVGVVDAFLPALSELLEVEVIKSNLLLPVDIMDERVAGGGLDGSGGGSNVMSFSASTLLDV